MLSDAINGNNVKIQEFIREGKEKLSLGIIVITGKYW